MGIAGTTKGMLAVVFPLFPLWIDGLPVHHELQLMTGFGRGDLRLTVERRGDKGVNGDQKACVKYQIKEAKTVVHKQNLHDLAQADNPFVALMCII